MIIWINLIIKYADILCERVIRREVTETEGLVLLGGRNMSYRFLIYIFVSLYHYICYYDITGRGRNTFF